MKFSAVKFSAIALSFSMTAAANAAAYPDKPIRMLVGFAAGGGTDTTARAIGQPLSEALGQQVIVDNRPGAAGNIAADITAHSVPDGYTILKGTIAALAINPSLYQKLPFDPIKDFEPISLAVSSMNVLVVRWRRRPSRRRTVRSTCRNQDDPRTVQGRCSRHNRTRERRSEHGFRN